MCRGLLQGVAAASPDDVEAGGGGEPDGDGRGRGEHRGLDGDDREGREGHRPAAHGEEEGCAHQHEQARVVGLRDGDDKAINLRTPWSSARFTPVGGVVSIPFAAEYNAEGIAGAGKVSSNVQYTIDYN